MLYFTSVMKILPIFLWVSAISTNTVEVFPLDHDCYCLDTKPNNQIKRCLPKNPIENDLTLLADEDAVIYAQEKGNNDNESWQVKTRRDEVNNNSLEYIINTINTAKLPYLCRVEWGYGLSQYRFFNESLTFMQTKGRCTEPNISKYNGQDFPLTSAWIASDWNRINLKWGVDNNNKLKPLLLNCDRKLKFLCEPDTFMVQVTEEQEEPGSRSEEVSNLWSIVIGGLGAAIIIVIVVVRKKKKKQGKLQSKLSANERLLTESTTRADQPDTDYSEVDDGNNKNKPEQKRQIQQREEESFYNEVDTNKDYSQLNKKTKQSNNLDDDEYNVLTFKTKRTTEKVDVDDTYDHMPQTIEEGTYDDCGQIKTEKFAEDYYDSVKKADG
ncbi:hypothetical protein KUTeg_003679 [Tegillarca granosa]|uniref:Uncharacterized protein n=1 Tax=Tegillarca granosa TaxID=220873 RepID=A0ABQ9FMT6_TEGGR|nr:hypothetical protein KUTeg_003679 [Tegillarca granosa]